jgi:hypothetical protein
MGGGILGNGVLGTADAGLGEHGFILGSTSRDLNAELPGAGGGMQPELFPGSVAELARIALDKEGSGFVGGKVEEAKEEQARDENGFVHGAVMEGLYFNAFSKRG